MSKIQEAIAQSGLTYGELADLFKITRATLYNWRIGRPPRSAFQAEFAEKMAGVVLKAVTAAKLPLPRGLSPRERKANIDRIVKEMLGGGG